MRKSAAIGLTVATLTLAGCGVPTTHTVHNGHSSTEVGSTTCTGLPSECGEPAATTTATEALPTPQDWTLAVIELSRKCFGSAGCNVEYRIVPAYKGPNLLKGSYMLLYELDGGDDTQTGNIEVRDGRYATEQGSVSTSGGTLTAHVTQILEN